MVGSEDDVEEDLEVLFWFFGEWVDCDIEGFRDLFFIWVVFVKIYYYILINISRIFKVFFVMKKFGEKLGEKFIFLLNFNFK